MALASRPKAPARYEDIVALPENLVGEIVAGELHASPRPANPHALASSALGGELVPTYQFGRGGPGDWWIIDEPELHLGDDVLVPDIAGWGRERMPEVSSGVAFVVPPDWVCEVLSPSTERLDRVGKLRVYARERVAGAWLVNPVTRTLEILRLEAGFWVVAATHGGDAVIRAEPFTEVEIDLLHLWGESRTD